LREELAKRGLDGFVVPHSDQHMGEYLPAYAERLAWLTAFTGSAGAAVVLKDKAAVFVDGRYTLQVRNQTDTKLFEPRDLVAEGPQGWIPDNLPPMKEKGGAKLGYDPWLHTQHNVMHLKAAVEKAGGTLVAVDSQSHRYGWSEHPRRRLRRQGRMPSIWRANRRGQTVAPGRRDVKKVRVEACVITLADSSAGCSIFRGHDVPHTLHLAFANSA
jgi:Xaa-Pro aminopeptidase